MGRINGILNFARCGVGTIDREDVVQTSGKGNDAVHFGAPYDMVPRRADRGDDLNPPGRTNRNIHEDVDRRGRRRGFDTELLEAIRQIVVTVGVTFIAGLLATGSVAAY